MSKYSFTITFNYYKQRSCLDDIKTINVSNITIAAKNAKWGGVYISKYVKYKKGSFKYIAGSIAYPILFPNKDKVELFITHFPHYPNLITKKDYIQISNIKQLL